LVFGSWPVLPLLLVELTSVGVLASAIHGRLAADRPGERHLTGFYLVLSAGGVLATAFVALVAPLVFPDVYEFPLLIVAAVAVLAIYRSPLEAMVWSPLRSVTAVVVAAGRRLLPYAVLGVVFFVLILAQRNQLPAVALLLVSGAAVIAVARSYRSLGALTALAIVALSIVQSANPLLKERTFFGVLQIRAADEGASRAEYSGTTLHGVQFIDARRTIPTSYYVRGGPLGDVFDDLAKRSASASVGVVGLGTGTIAAYERPTDSMTFFEIDPAVVRLASDPHWFTYLADAPVPPRVVVGDGRLSLESEAKGSFDVLVLDAFSSDNVPAHLLTREAIETYRRAMRPGGIIVFHISNRSYDLAPGIVSTAQSMGLAGRQLAYQPGPARERDEGADGSDWVVVGDFVDITRFVQRGWGSPRPGPVLTDDFFDLLRMLRALQF
jgi:SAM-dependent methyltransferase